MDPCPIKRYKGQINKDGKSENWSGFECIEFSYAGQGVDSE